MMALGLLGHSPLGLLGLDPEERKKLAVWAKGHPIPGQDRQYWCMDDYGKWLFFPHHGDRNSPYGWEMDHYPIPKALGGSNDLSNLRPLHCRKNASLGGILGGIF